MSKEGSATILIKLSSLSYLKLHKLEKIIRNHGQKWRGYFPKNNQIHTLSSWKQNIVSLTGQTYLNSVCKCVWPFSKHQAFTNVLNLYGLKTTWLIAPWWEVHNDGSGKFASTLWTEAFSSLYNFTVQVVRIYFLTQIID